MVDVDYVIADAGAAGCVLARLSEDPGNLVFLLEYGGHDTKPLPYVPEGFYFTLRAASRARALNRPGIAACVAATDELVSHERATLAGQEEGGR